MLSIYRSNSNDMFMIVPFAKIKHLIMNGSDYIEQFLQLNFHHLHARVCLVTNNCTFLSISNYTYSEFQTATRTYRWKTVLPFKEMERLKINGQLAVKTVYCINARKDWIDIGSLLSKRQLNSRVSHFFFKKQIH